jgi:hypothetical protein
MLGSIIKKISSEFIDEAQKSPKLLEDLAMMEKYISESYNQRILIELLQNSDDAESSHVKMYFDGTNLFFANNGRPFNESDVISISRSGSSSKQRGTTIGYRGIGFKSTSFLSDSIIIKSSGEYFTFSKSYCAKILNKQNSQVPTIRIPFYVNENEVNEEIAKTCEGFEKKGYSTVFIFQNANLSLILEEIDMLNDGYFIFLRNINRFSIEIYPNENEYNITRKQQFSDNDFSGKTTKISTKSKEEEWLVVKSDFSDVAFKIKDGNLVAATDAESIIHAFLPTSEKIGFPFKINGDFSTDPSRKHVVLDDTFKKIIDDATNVFVNLLKKAFENEVYAKTFGGLIAIYNGEKAYSRIPRYIKDCLDYKLKENLELTLQINEILLVKNYKQPPKWIENSEAKWIADYSDYAKKITLKGFVYQYLFGVDYFIDSLTILKWELNDLVNIISEKNFVEKANVGLIANIFANIVNEMYYDKNQDLCNVFVNNCYVKTENVVVLISQVRDSLPANFVEKVKSITTKKALAWLDEKQQTSFQKIIYPEKIYEDPGVNNGTTENDDGRDGDLPNKELLSPPKWRTAEQICLEIETKLGNVAEDVSRQNLGYDVLSTTKNGSKRYIEVKSGKDKIVLTNNEYASASVLADNYYICLLNQTDSEIRVKYVKNPVATLTFEKRVKQWEWLCEEVRGEEKVYKTK